jgi:hypothetical protein
MPDSAKLGLETFLRREEKESKQRETISFDVFHFSQEAVSARRGSRDLYPPGA